MPTELFAVLLQGDPNREAKIGKELDWIMAGHAKAVGLSLDPATAFSVANALQIALAENAPPPASRDHLREIDRGIEAQIAPQCPELARLLNDCRRIKGV